MGSQTRPDRSSGLLAAVLGLIALVVLGLAFQAGFTRPVDSCPDCGLLPQVSPSAVATPFGYGEP